MFNVSALLLDDALNMQATPLANGVIKEMLRQFATLSDISQGIVATHLKRGWILVIVLWQFFSWFWQWNNFENRLIFDKVKAYKNIVSVLGAPYSMRITVAGIIWLQLARIRQDLFMIWKCFVSKLSVAIVTGELTVTLNIVHDVQALSSSVYIYTLRENRCKLIRGNRSCDNIGK